MQKFEYRVTYDAQDGTGTQWVDRPTVTVYISGTSTLAVLYDDEGTTAKANPFIGPTTGLVSFYAADGKYKVNLSGGYSGYPGPTIAVPYELDAVLLDDTLGLASLSQTTGVLDINSLTAATQSLTTGTSGSDFAISSAGSTHTFNLPTASSTRRGALTSGDWTTFNSKLGSLNTLTASSQVFAVGNSGTSPNWSSSVSTHTLNLPYAAGSISGILSSSDFQSFSSKEPALGVGNSAQFLRGDKVWANLTTDAVTEATALYFTTARARAALSGTSPIGYSSSTGIISIQAGSGSQPGHISSADWTTFNSKVSSVAVGTANTDFTATLVGSAVTLDLPIASPSIVGGKVSNATQSFSGDKTFYGSLITSSGRRRSVYVHQAPAGVTLISTIEVVVVNKSVAGATAVTLPSAPTTGQTHWIIDGAGNASGNTITITPASGNINGAANITITADYGWREVIYSGSQWLAR